MWNLNTPQKNAKRNLAFNLILDLNSASWIQPNLLLLLDMHCMLPQPGTELLNTKLLSTRSSLKGVVVISGFLAHQVDDLFLLALRHD